MFLSIGSTNPSKYPQNILCFVTVPIGRIAVGLSACLFICSVRSLAIDLDHHRMTRWVAVTRRDNPGGFCIPFRSSPTWGHTLFLLSLIDHTSTLPAGLTSWVPMIFGMDAARNRRVGASLTFPVFAFCDIYDGSQHVAAGCGRGDEEVALSLPQ